MGRGASDLTASALAKALDADACEIYTDVTGVFSADPRIVPQARKLRPRQLRRDARDGRRRVQGARPALGRVRPQPRRRRSTCARRSRGSRARGSPTTPIDDPRSVRWKIRSSPASSPTRSESKVTVLGVPDRPGHLGDAVRAARRGQRQRRHDRAEHVDRGHDRHQLHDAVGRHGRRRGHRRAGRRRDRRGRRHPRRATSPRCRSSAPA